MVDLAIIIVSYNTRSDLEACLESIDRHPPHVTHEVIVVDNASTDGSIASVRSRWPNVRTIALERNVGFAAANNHGIRQSQSRMVLLLNSDTMVTNGALDRLIEAIETLPGAAIVGSKLVDRRGRPELSFGAMMSPIAEVRQKLLARLGDRRIKHVTSIRAEVDWVSGACLLVRRSAADAAGLLDERYFMYCEDVDFCAAVRATGARVYFEPGARVIHSRGGSSPAGSDAARMLHRRSHLAFYEKHYPALAPFLRLYFAIQGKLPSPRADKQG